MIDYQQNQYAGMHMQQLKGLGVPHFTFDPDDAQRYGLTPQCSRCTRSAGIFSPGCSSRMGHLLSGAGQEPLRYCCAPWRCSGSRWFAHLHPHGARARKKPLPRLAWKCCPAALATPDNIDTINRSRCLLLKSPRPTRGLTVRCPEAPFFHKKLITNNTSVCNLLPVLQPRPLFRAGQG